MRSGPRFTRSAALVLAAGVGLGALTACGGSSGGSGTTPSPTPTAFNEAAAKADVKTNWEKFWSRKTSNAEKLTFLESGTAGLPALKKSASLQPASVKIKTTVTGVVIQPDHQSALVTYNIALNGQNVITGGTGTAVYQDGTWKVSQSAFCSLVSQAGKIPGCG